MILPVLDAELDIAARTVAAEARGEPHEGKIAVAWVLKNRVLKKHRGETTLAGVCTEPYQFSCWNVNDPNRVLIYKWMFKDLQNFGAALAVQQVFKEDVPDPTQGSTYYFSNSMKEWPKWAVGKKPAVIIGNHLFFNNID